MTSPATPTATVPDLPAAAPTWLVHGVGAASAIAGTVVAVWHPNGAFSAPAASAAVFVAGWLIYGILVAVHTVSRNGLTKAGLARSVSEEEAWIRANIGDLKDTFATAKGIVASVDPQLVARTASTVDELKSRVDQLPAGAVGPLADLLAGHSIVTTTGTVDVPAKPTPADQSVTAA